MATKKTGGGGTGAADAVSAREQREQQEAQEAQTGRAAAGAQEDQQEQISPADASGAPTPSVVTERAGPLDVQAGTTGSVAGVQPAIPVASSGRGPEEKAGELTTDQAVTRGMGTGPGGASAGQGVTGTGNTVIASLQAGLGPSAEDVERYKAELAQVAKNPLDQAKQPGGEYVVGGERVNAFALPMGAKADDPAAGKLAREAAARHVTQSAGVRNVPAGTAESPEQVVERQRREQELEQFRQDRAEAEREQ